MADTVYYDNFVSLDIKKLWDPCYLGHCTPARRDSHVDAIVPGSYANVVNPSHISDMVDVCCNQKHSTSNVTIKG